MKKKDTLYALAAVLQKSKEFNLNNEYIRQHLLECADDLIAEAMRSMQKLLDKRLHRNCRIPLLIDFKEMTKSEYWFESDLLRALPPKESNRLKGKLESLIDKLRELRLKMSIIDTDWAKKLLHRMFERCKKEHHIFDYDYWRLDHKHPTLDMLINREIELTKELILSGVLDYDYAPSGGEVKEVRIDLVLAGLEDGTILPEWFEKACAKIRRYSYWVDKTLFMINYSEIYDYLFKNCFDKLTSEQRMMLFEYDVQLQMIHKDIVKLRSDLAKYLNKPSSGSLEGTNLFAPYKGIVEMLEGDWFAQLRSDKKYNDRWAKAFADGLMRSEYGSAIAERWKENKVQILGCLLGCLKSAGVFNQNESNDNIAREAAIMDNSRTFGKYIGKQSQEQPYAEWIKTNVDKYC